MNIHEMTPEQRKARMKELEKKILSLDTIDFNILSHFGGRFADTKDYINMMFEYDELEKKEISDIGHKISMYKPLGELFEIVCDLHLEDMIEILDLAKKYKAGGERHKQINKRKTIAKDIQLNKQLTEIFDELIKLSPYMQHKFFRVLKIWSADAPTGEETA
jgi:hypothetical protein